MKRALFFLLACGVVFAVQNPQPAHADSWAAFHLGETAIRELGDYMRNRDGQKTFHYSENRQINNDNPLPYGPPRGMFGDHVNYSYDTSYGRGGQQTLPSSNYYGGEGRYQTGYGGVRFDPYDCFISQYDGQRYCRQIQ